MQQNDAHAAFDAAAADFTELGRHLWDPIGGDLVAAADPQPGQRVLDACCGAGASALPAARRVGPSGVVDAVDISESMVDQVRAHAADLPQVRAHSTDVTEWSTSDGVAYDLVLSGLGIFFFPDMTAGTRHLIGMVRPGGRVALAIWRGDAMAEAGRHLGRAVAAATGAAEPAPRQGHLFDEINQADSFGPWLTGLGLSDVDVTVRERRLETTDELAWLVVLGSGFRGTLSSLEPDVVDDVRRRYLASLRAGGVTQLDATTLIAVGSVPPRG